ncbi:MAG: TetR/AcrR family transcriptional regulator [Kofleriaceae bacterium]
MTTSTSSKTAARESKRDLAKVASEAVKAHDAKSKSPDAGATTPTPEPSAKGEHRAKGDKREAILDAALELFVERGFFGTAVPEIADKAGVGAGTIYRYFESKEALVNAIYRQQKQSFAGVVLADFPANSSTRDQFRTMWMRMAKFATENPQAFVFMELHHHQRYLDDESRALEQRMLDLFTGVVVAAQGRRELKAGPPRLLMGIVMGAFVGVIRSCVEFEQPLEQADWVLAEQVLWEAVRA